MARKQKIFFNQYYGSQTYEVLPSTDRERLCEAVECLKKGTYRAPKNRENLENYRWFCKEHVEEYNAHWDYLKGLSPEEIEKEIRADVFWRRTAGHKLTQFRLGDREKRMDPFGFFGNFHEGSPRQKDTKTSSLPDDIALSLQVLGVSFPVTLVELKQVYKKKVKQYHPDLHGGSKEAEDHLKEINRAFQVVEEFLSVENS